MGTRFVMALLAAFALTLGALGGAGFAISRIAVSPPRDVFRAGIFQLELAKGWWCELDGTEYVCTPPGKPPHPAIAVIAMKERNNKDTLDAYEEHLRQPQPAATRDGETARAGALSEIRFVRRRAIGSHSWVEALHSGSEVPNFDTYYLGTTTAMIGILVTLSVHKDHSAEYIDRLNQMIETLEIYQN